MRVTGISWLGLSVNDCDATVAFFRDVMGAENVGVYDDDSAKFSVGDRQVIELFGPKSDGAKIIDTPTVLFRYAFLGPVLIRSLKWAFPTQKGLDKQAPRIEDRTMFIRAYLRASTSEQDASRARGVLEAFAVEQGLRIAARYVENESGAKLHRPELFRLLNDCEPGDVLLVEQVDRLSRLTSPDWLRLRGLIDAKQVRIVALDLPTSWTLTATADEFTGRMFAAVNAMMLDVLAAVARKDYEDRRRRQAEGTAKAKAAGLYKGRPANKTRNAAISSLLSNGRSWREIMDATGCSRTLLAKIARDRRLLSAATPVETDE